MAQSFYEATLKYRNFFQVVAWPMNPLLRIAQWVHIADSGNDGVTYGDKLAIQHYLELSRIGLPDGMYRRGARVGVGDISHDELEAVAFLAHYFDWDLAKKILAYGQSTFWRFDVMRSEIPRFRFGPGPRWRYWLGRIVHFPGFIYAAAGARPPLVWQYLWKWQCMWTAWNNDDGVSSRLLFTLQLDIVQPYPVMASGAAYFRRKMSQRYPSGESELYALYFANPNEPGYAFTEFAKKTF